MRCLSITFGKLLLLSFSFTTCSMMANSTDAEPVVHNFSTRRNYTYTPSDFNVFRREDGSLYTEPFNPIVHLGEAAEETAGYSIIPEEAVSADEKVLKRIVPGRDGRMPIMNPELWPYRVHGRLSINFEGREYGGSGTLIGPHHLLTAGHNVFSKESGWASRILVSFAANGNYLPFDQQQAIKVYAYKKWIDEFDEEYDISLLVLERPIGNKVGWYGLVHLPQAIFSERPIHIVGYPKEVSDSTHPDQETILVGQFKKMWGMTHDHFEITPEKIYYQIDTSPGQSGSSIWYDGVEDKKYVVGIHAYGEGELGRGNFGVRINRKKFENLITWISETRNVEVVPAIERLLVRQIPEIARGYEQIYQQFMGGKLIYKPNRESNTGRIEFPIAALYNPLEGTFDLSHCGDSGRYVSIATGYKKGKKVGNWGKLEISIVPKFLIEQELDTTAGHFRDIMHEWTAPIGVFWTWGNWSNLIWYDYLVAKSPAEISTKSLYGNWQDRSVRPSMPSTLTQLSEVFVTPPMTTDKPITSHYELNFD